jgi:coenzyme F420-0:L-glutamate ligase/coenzyme F420-1:gamma-L-glutamate ligase
VSGEAATLLAFLRSRRSVREFSAEPIERAVLDRLISAAVTAPSSSNRQPWHFTVVTSPERRRQIAAAVKARADEMKAIIRRGHHAEDFGSYGDFFHEPLERAAAIVVPHYREVPDLLAKLVASGGGDPSRFETGRAMQAELASTSAAVMVLLLAAHAEGLGACWMAGPMISRDEVSRLCDVGAPWRMLGAVALGHVAPSTVHAPKPNRKPMERVVEFIE